MEMIELYIKVKTISDNDLFYLKDITIRENQVEYCFVTDDLKLLWIDGNGISGPPNLSENYINTLRIVENKLKEKGYI